MKKRYLALLLAVLMFIPCMPAVSAAGERVPIYTANMTADYLAQQLLKEIPTEGKTPVEQIRAVYDWIILNCKRESEDWDGVIYADEEAVKAEVEAFTERAVQDEKEGKLLVWTKTHY